MFNLCCKDYILESLDYNLLSEAEIENITDIYDKIDKQIDKLNTSSQLKVAYLNYRRWASLKYGLITLAFGALSGTVGGGLTYAALNAAGANEEVKILTSLFAGLCIGLTGLFMSHVKLIPLVSKAADRYLKKMSDCDATPDEKIPLLLQAKKELNLLLIKVKSKKFKNSEEIISLINSSLEKCELYIKRAQDASQYVDNMQAYGDIASRVGQNNGDSSAGAFTGALIGGIAHGLLRR